MNKEQQKKKISKLFWEIMETLWLDLKDESLSWTPKRVAKMYVEELFYGLDEKNFPRVMTVSNWDWETVWYTQMLIEKDIKVHSTCEHHFVPIIWKAHIAYFPNKKVIWLSKINRIVDFYARKPQIQERMTEEIHSKLCEILETEDVAVLIDAKHFCVITRGIKDINSSTITSKFSGCFEKKEIKKEFLDLIK